MTYKELKDILNSMNQEMLEEPINFEYLNRLIQKNVPTPVSVGNQPTTGFSNPFAGTSWGN